MPDTMEEKMEHSKSFLHFLTKYRGAYYSETQGIVKDPQYAIPLDRNFNKTIVARSCDYYELLAFRTMIAEMFFQAVNMFPYISEYKIECTNTKGKGCLSLGIYTETDDEDELTVCKIQNNHFEYNLNKNDVQNLYISNKTNLHDSELVDFIINSLYYIGPPPIVKTSYKSLASYRKC
jgi:hypothetical protein